MAKSTDSRGTPQYIIDAVSEVFPIYLDACASEWNTKAAIYYDIDQGSDGLLLHWSSITWCNPPYSDIQPWTRKAEQELADHRVQSILLLPARTEMAWFQRVIYLHYWNLLKGDRARVKVGVKFLPKRINFDYPPGEESKKGNPERSIMVYFGFEIGEVERVHKKVVDAQIAFKRSRGTM